MLRYLLGQVNSQKGGKSEAEHPNSHRWWHKSVEELEGIASSFWQPCAPSSKEAGAAGGRETQSSHGLESSGSWCREGLSPGSAPSSLPGLPWENSLIYFFISHLVDPLFEILCCCFPLRWVKWSLSPFQTPSSPHYT